MAKTKTQRELLSNISNSPVAFNYDLTRVRPDEYAAPLTVLFNSEKWKDVFIRRKKLFRAAMTRDQMALKQIIQIDQKVGMMLLSAMFQYSQERSKQIDGGKVTLNEYFTDFVRTPEQHELYDKFSLEIDMALCMSDIMENVLNDAKSSLRKLDPALVLSEYDALKEAMKALSDFSHIQHRDEHNDLTSLFLDYAEEVEDYLRIKTALFASQYKNLREALIAKGEIKAKTIKKHTDREYVSDLLANYIFVMTDKESVKVQASQLAKKAINALDDKEIEEVMPALIEFYRQSQNIHMAKDKIATTKMSLPNTEATKKIAPFIV